MNNIAVLHVMNKVIVMVEYYGYYCCFIKSNIYLKSYGVILKEKQNILKLKIFFLKVSRVNVFFDILCGFR